MSDPDPENFPIAREPTSIEVEYIEDVYRMSRYAGKFFFCFFLPLISLSVLVFSLLLGMESLLFIFVLSSVFLGSVVLGIRWYSKSKRKKYTGEPLREVRGTVSVRRDGVGFFPYLYGRLVRVPDQWRDELGELQQPVHALIYPLNEDKEWAALEINGWLSVERDVEDKIVSTRTFLRMPGFNPLYWIRALDFGRRYRKLRREEQHEGLEDAYTESPLDKG